MRALLSLIKVLTLILSLGKGAKKDKAENAYEIQGEAHEIDLKVARGGLSNDDIERVRKYERANP